MSEPETTPAEALTIIHREYVLWHWRDLDPCLWRFFRNVGPWRPLPETDDALLDPATGQIVARAATHGDLSYTLGFLAAAAGEAGPDVRFTGAIVLLPQATGTTQVQVVRFGAADETTAAIDAGLRAVWQAARGWVAEFAAGQPAAQRAGAVALPRRARTS